MIDKFVSFLGDAVVVDDDVLVGDDVVSDDEKRIEVDTIVEI